jgi:hypothetical protein
MRRLVDHWWLVGSALLAAVIVLTCVLYAGVSDSHRQQQRATQHQAVLVLSQSVDDVLARESWARFPAPLKRAGPCSRTSS